MKIFRPFFLASALAAPAAAMPTAAEAAVEVTFTNPEDFTDAQLHRSRGARDRAMVLDRLRQHLQKLGERHLAPGQTLAIEVLDVDLAGRSEWWRFGYDARVLRDFTSPSMKLRYTLREDGQDVRSGEEMIADRGYMVGGQPTDSTDTLRYEKAMLERWFRTTFGGASQS